MSKPSRGEIWFVNLHSMKLHSGLIVSDDFSDHSPGRFISIVPLTTEVRRRSDWVAVNPPEGGLKQISYIICRRRILVDRECLVQRLGKVSPATLAAVEERLNIWLMAEQMSREEVLEETRAFIAHEVRSAIGPLRVVAELLNKALTQPEIDRNELTEYTQRILKQTQAAYDVVERYVEYTQPLTPKLEPTDMNQLLEESLDEFRAECVHHHIGICQKLDQIPNVSMDRALIAQALRNVLLNGIEAMAHGGTLTVATHRKGDGVIIRISDTGPGIKPEHLNRIFELGFTTKLGRRGGGIGLALARRIVEEAHGGQITITNHPSGVGAIVTIRLPIKEEMPDGKQNFAANE
ncbi:type II toxin-antitoxin system PemK/MazF family toxin [Candidatus Poribacteria bacterium]|nr:type II toxin-antitoxin system PemK/MazF family toxin [Candidatus Poribacteria bacterium]